MAGAACCLFIVRRLRLLICAQSGFEPLFSDDGDAAEQWAPFVDVQLQMQEKLLDQIVGSSDKGSKHDSAPTRCFSRVDSRIRAELKKVIVCF